MEAFDVEDIFDNGGWLENPFASYAPNEKTKEFKPFDDHASSIRHTTTAAISEIEVGGKDGCRDIKITSLVFAVLVVLLFIGLIVSVYLNTNKVTCGNTVQTCPPCPICPSSLLQSNTSFLERMCEVPSKFYIRDRVSHHSLFLQRGSYIYSEKGDVGTTFIYNTSDLTIRLLPDNLFMYVSIDGGPALVSSDPYQKINLKEYIHTFDVDMKGVLTSSHINEEEEYTLVCKDNFLFFTDEEVEYKYKISIFKENPNIIQGVK